MKKRLLCSIIALLSIASVLKAQEFSKFIRFGVNSPFLGTTFTTTCQLRDTSGYLILGNRYTPTRDAFVIRTDTLLNEVWTTAITVQNAQFPYDNPFFCDIGQLLNGNIYLLGVAGPGGTRPHYILFLLDTGGNVIQHVAFHDSLNNTNGAYFPEVYVAPDSSLYVTLTEYERFGYYRFDQQLNMLSDAHYITGPFNNTGNDCLRLQDNNMLVANSNGLTKTDTNGVLIWSRSYSGISQIFDVHESASGSIYISASATTSVHTAALAKVDANGNPLFLHYYSMTPGTATAPGIRIFEDGNDLVIGSDSIIFRIDTNGTTLGWGKTIDGWPKYMRQTYDGNYVIAGEIMQDSTGWYEYSIMKFYDTTSNTCLRPRSIITVAQPFTSYAQSPATVPVTIVFDSVQYGVVPVNLDFDTFNGCPEGPMGTQETPAAAAWRAYSNPASHIILFEPGSAECRNTFLDVYDAQGKLITTQAMMPGTALDVSLWQNGLYNAVIRNADGSVTSLTFAVLH